MSTIASSDPFAIPVPLAVNGPSGRHSWLSQAQARFRDLSLLPRNWDSYDADPGSPECLAAAWALAVRLAAVPSVPLPLIHLTRDGGVHFEWLRGQRSFSIELADPRTMHLHYGDWENKEEEESSIPVDGPLIHVIELIGKAQSIVRAGDRP